MKKTSEDSIRSLREEAERSGDNEAFKVLAKIDDCRIGIGARLESPKATTFFIEILVSLCTGCDQVDLELMERKLLLLKRLNQKGYVLNCEEDGCVSCELTVESKDLTAGCLTASSILERHLKARNGQARLSSSGA